MPVAGDQHAQATGVHALSNVTAAAIAADERIAAETGDLLLSLYGNPTRLSLCDSALRSGGSFAFIGTARVNRPGMIAAVHFHLKNSSDRIH
ncbi:MAG TPA: hypothetical protein VI231_00780 [Candidatus Binatia bacterium]